MLKNLLRSFLLFICLVNNLFGIEIKSSPVGCSKNSSTKKVILESSLVLNSNFIPEAQKNIFVDEAIERQVKHLLGFVKNTRHQEMRAALMAYRRIVSKEVTEGEYGMEMVLESYLPDERMARLNDYVNSALKKGITGKRDKAIIVNYKIELLLADCSMNDFFKKTLPLLPRDPYLSLWIQNKSLHEKRALGPFTLKEASTCHSIDMAVFGGVDNDWYFWQPLNEKGLLCTHSDESHMVNAKLTEVETLMGASEFKRDFLKKGELASYFIFGKVDESDFYTKTQMDEIKNVVEQSLNECLGKKDQCLNFLTPYLGPQKDGKYYEPGVHAFLTFLKYLNRFIDLKKFVINKKLENDLALDIDGVLKNSEQKVRMEVYFGNTSLESAIVRNEYMRFLHSAFSKGDMISYVGHAGLGENLKTDRLIKKWKEMKLSVVKRQNSLWLGIYNCEAVSYFGFDLGPLFKKGRMRVLETFTSGTNSGAEFPLMQLSSLQDSIGKKNVLISDHIKFNPKYPNEFLVENFVAD